MVWYVFKVPKNRLIDDRITLETTMSVIGSKLRQSEKLLMEIPLVQVKSNSRLNN